MPHIYGQLLNAQLENSVGDPASGGTAVGRIYIDTTSSTGGVAKYYNGSSFVPFSSTVMTNNNTATATFNTAGYNETIYNTGVSTLASCTITLPATSSIGQICRYSSSPLVASVTIAGTVTFGTPVTALVGTIAYQAINTTGSFIRIQ